MGYFNVTVKPEIPASKQHAAAFTTGDNLFGWVSFEIPKGGAKLIGATMMVRPKGNASPTPNQFGAYLMFATNDTGAAWVLNGAAAREPFNDWIGFVEFDDNTSFVQSTNSTSVAVSGRAASDNNTHPSIVFAREDGSEGQGSSVGYDKFYMRGIANGAFDFTSINVINDSDINSTTPAAIVMAGSGMDVREHFIAGDVLHAQDDILLGTIDTVTDATTGPINLTVATSGAGDATTVANGDTIYNLNPIRVVLHFEN